jgi:glutamyl-tRNA synthetase/glutamyl-Q tRNA(Asp) synthetase
VWNAARDRRGRVLLRIEDHDRERCRPEYERGILDDLDWLGYVPDVYPTEAFRAGRSDGRQSDREPIYRDALEQLRAKGLVYACDCTRRQIAAGSIAEGELRYPGTCRDRGLPLTDGMGWRVRLAPRTERFVDERLGLQEQNPQEQCGDVLVRDRHGNWTYQFCVSVDDLVQGIDLVIRGEDLLASTGRQIALARLLGRDRPPSFLHHPLIMKAPGQKLSKSDGDTAIRDLRRRGLIAAEVKRLATGRRAKDQ